MIKGFVFDMDGLLFDSERIVQRSWSITGERLGIVPDVGEQIYHTVGFNRARRMEYFRKIYGEDFPADAFNRETRKQFYEIVVKEGLPLKEGAADLLKALKERSFKIALATSSSQDYATRILKEADIFWYFDDMMFGNMVSRSKPDPEIYKKACLLIGTEPGETIALEDAPSGVTSAWRAGLHVIMVPDLVLPDTETKSRTWKIVGSLAEVLPLLDTEYL